MAKHKRLIPSLAALSVSLTGCGSDVADDDITGAWDVTVADVINLPVYNYESMTATGGAYDGFGYGYTVSLSGTLVIDSSGGAEWTASQSYSYVYSDEYGSESESETCTYSYYGLSKHLEQRRFEIRFDSSTEVCESSDGDRHEDSGTAEMNLDCVLHPEWGVLDCIERTDGGYWAFERSEDK